MGFEVLLAIALIPPALFLLLIWRIDKLEHEPWSLLLIVTGLGAACALLALVLEIAVDGPIAAIFDDNYAVYIIVDNFVGVALMEELSKMLVVMLVVWRHKQFNCRFDGVVYGAASSLGFAALENVKYVVAYGFETGIVRAFTAIPGHFIFGIFMGAMIGAAKCAKYDGKQGKKNLFLLLAILVPTCVHGYYDYLLSIPDYMGGAQAQSIWIVYLIAMVICAVIVIIWNAKHDRVIDPSLGFSGEAKTPATGANALLQQLNQQLTGQTAAAQMPQGVQGGYIPQQTQYPASYGQVTYTPQSQQATYVPQSQPVTYYPQSQNPPQQ